jgi:hypothetical protein
MTVRGLLGAGIARSNQSVSDVAVVCSDYLVTGAPW